MGARHEVAQHAQTVSVRGTEHAAHVHPVHLLAAEHAVGHGLPAALLTVALSRGLITREIALQLAAEAHEAARSGALSGRNDLPPFEQIAEAFREPVAD